MTLEPIDPETAVELYLANRENDISNRTLRSHRKRLSHFIRWCNDQGIENLNDLTGRQLHEYRVWRRNDGDLKPVSEKAQMDTLRVFIRWLESIDGVKENLSEKVISPSPSAEANTREVMLEHDRATKVLTYLEKYHYASARHVTIALMWHTMMRVGAIRSLDIADYHSADQYLEVQHRPDTETPIKNQEHGERLVALSEQLCDLLDDWLADQRPEVVDDHGREPLLATAEGRPHVSTLRTWLYQHTQPCQYTGECPHDRDPEECEATEYHAAGRCPSSVSPHAVRRGSITHSLSSDMPEKVVSDRANVSEAVLDQHYDQRTEKERMEQRRQYLDNI